MLIYIANFPSKNTISPSKKCITVFISILPAWYSSWWENNDKYFFKGMKTIIDKLLYIISNIADINNKIVNKNNYHYLSNLFCVKLF